jgi:hypothetical protein
MDDPQPENYLTDVEPDYSKTRMREAEKKAREKVNKAWAELYR